MRRSRRGKYGAVRTEVDGITFLPGSRRIDVTGQKFGRLTAVSYQGWNGAHKTLWLFRCECGQEVVRRLATVRQGGIQSCGCLRREGGYVAHNRKEVGESAFNSLYSGYRRAAGYRGHDFALSKEEFRELTKSSCYYCGAQPGQVKKATSGGGSNGDYVYTGVDRVDNDIGYVAGNVVPCCAVCNRAKHVLAQGEFISWVGRVYRCLEGAGLV